ncbi:MAG: hypothetical protein HY063_13690 [Bacteroidetes bacterium]|nr:hypothetical protein [Bacteroidota bacterium]
MAKKKSKGPRVPRKLNLFDNYIVSVVAFLFSTNAATGNLWWVDLLLTNAEAGQLQTYNGKWRTGNPANPGVYEIHTNPDTKGKKSRKNVINLRDAFTTFIGTLLTRMSASPAITSEARLVLHIAEPNPKKEKVKDGIKEQVFYKEKDLGGGDHEFLCATEHDSKLPSVADTADGIVVSYSIVDVAGEKAAAKAIEDANAKMVSNASKTNTPPVVIEPVEMTPAPSEPEECDKQKVFSGHKFLLHLGMNNKGKILYMFLQWNDSKNPNRIGPANNLITIVI